MRKILIADDSSTTVMHLSILIRRMGFTVLTAGDGMETLRLLAKDSLDLLLLDLNMPLLDGYSVLRQLRADPRHNTLPIVVVTIEGDDHSRKHCTALGATAFLSKPVHLSVLHDVVQTALAPGGMSRKHMRAHFQQKVGLCVNGERREITAVTLSEGGIYLRTASPLPDGVHVQVEIPVGPEETLRVGGTVLYQKQVYGGEVKMDPGFAVGFDPLEPRQAFHLRCFVKDLLAAGVVSDPEGSEIIV